MSKIEIHADIDELVTSLLNSNPNCLFVIDANIYSLYKKSFAIISDESFLILHASEHAKDLGSFQKIIDKIFALNLGKADYIIAIGGGVIGDIVGFSASLYKRGLNLIHVPTTLLAMADSSVGGKNAINYHNIKNLIGSIYEAKEIHICTKFLQSLPFDDVKSGISEICKMAIISSNDNVTKLLSYSSNYELHLDKMIKMAIDEKIKITKIDLHDKNERKFLNFGHSFGHAIEAIFQERKNIIAHGLCVSLGMVMEVELAFYKKICNTDTKNKVIDLLKQYQLPININEFSINNDNIITEILTKLRFDKKNIGRKISFALPMEIGKCNNFSFTEDEIIEFLTLILK